MTSKKLITHLKETGAVRTLAIEEAFRAVDRASFVRADSEPLAYADSALPIGYGQTISQPTVVALCMEWLAPRSGDRILDVGSGSGWTTALLAHIVGSGGSVIGVERVPELVAFGQANLAKFSLQNARIELEGPELGFRKMSPYDRILVSAAADEIPRALTDQLAEGGRMVMPIRNAICVVDRVGDELTTVCHPGFAFVPLIT